MLELDAFTAVEGNGMWLFRDLDPAACRARIWRRVVLVPFASRLSGYRSVEDVFQKAHVGGNGKRSLRRLTTRRTEP